jgi:hypothetical protein
VRTDDTETKATAFYRRGRRGIAGEEVKGFIPGFLGARKDQRLIVNVAVLAVAVLCVPCGEKDLDFAVRKRTVLMLQPPVFP